MRVERDWSSMDLQTLKDLYQRESRDFEGALLAGTDWQSLRDQRITLTRISQALYRKTTQQGPPGFFTRNERPERNA